MGAGRAVVLAGKCLAQLLSGPGVHGWAVTATCVTRRRSCVRITRTKQEAAGRGRNYDEVRGHELSHLIRQKVRQVCEGGFRTGPCISRRSPARCQFRVSGVRRASEALFNLGCDGDGASDFLNAERQLLDVPSAGRPCHPAALAFMFPFTDHKRPILRAPRYPTSPPPSRARPRPSHSGQAWIRRSLGPSSCVR